jgi:hypothetical protein
MTIDEPLPEPLLWPKQAPVEPGAFHQVMDGLSTGNIPDLTAAVMARFTQDLGQSPHVPCSYDATFVSAYLDRQLGDASELLEVVQAKVDMFEKHLPGCSPCNHHMASLSEIMDIYRHYLYRLETTLHMPDLAPRVMSRLKPNSRASLLMFPARRLAGIAAMVLLIAGVGLMWRPLPSPVMSAALRQAATPEQVVPKMAMDTVGSSKQEEQLALAVIYQSPEAYLFASHEEAVSAEQDVSVLVFEE